MRRWRWPALLGALVVVSGAAWWLGARSQSPEQAAARAAEPDASWVTAVVERRVLSATVIMRGDVQPEAEFSVGVPVSVEGDPVVTQVVVTAGSEIVEGGRVAEVSGRPIFVASGPVPVYRTLRPGMGGADVAQLQAALNRLGYQTDDDGVFGPLTKAGLTAFYADAGYEPIPASTTEAADLAAAEQAATDAEAALSAAQRELDMVESGQPASAIAAAESAYNQSIRDLDAALLARDQQLALARARADEAAADRDRLGADPSTAPADLSTAQLRADEATAALAELDLSTGSAVDQAREALTVADLALDEVRGSDGFASAQAAVEAATRARDRAAVAVDQLVAVNGPTVPKGEFVFVPSLPVRVIAAVGSIGPFNSSPAGESVAGSASLATLATGRLVVVSSVRPGDVGLIRVGMPVELLDETTSQTFTATVDRLDDDTLVASADGQVGYSMVLVASSPLPDSLSGVNVRVTVTAASTPGEELVVPLAAVSGASNGTARVTVVGNPNDAAPTDIEVHAGLSADGFVAIEPVTPGAIDVGDLVVVGR